MAGCLSRLCQARHSIMQPPPQHHAAALHGGLPVHPADPAAAVQGQALEDPLDNEEHLQEQLESLPYLCRFQSEKMSSYFCSAFDARLQRYTAISQGSPPSSNIELQVRPHPPPLPPLVLATCPLCCPTSASPE